MVIAPAHALPDVERTRLTTSELALGGMHCSACATRIERKLARLPAVASASVNLATTRAFVSYDPSTLDVEQICQAVADVGYTAEPVDPDHRVPATGKGDAWGIRAALSWPLAIAALAVSLLASETAGPGWAVLLLAVAVEIVGGWPFLRNAARLALHGATNMDTLVALGTLAAVTVNAVEVIALGGRHIHIGTGSGAFASRLHFAMAPIIVSILVSARTIEARARRRAADAMHALLSLRPATPRGGGGPATTKRGSSSSPRAFPSVPSCASVRARPSRSTASSCSDRQPSTSRCSRANRCRSIAARATR
jgi:Cu+-exporting ATPase